MIVQFAICQSGSTNEYPKILEINGTRVVVFSPEQAQKVQLLKLDYDEATETLAELGKRLELDSLVIESLVIVKDGNKRERELFGKIVTNDSITISEKKEEIQDLKKRNIKLSTTNKILGGTTIGLAIAVLIQILK